MAAGPPPSTATSDETAAHLGGDAAHYTELVGPLVEWLDRIVAYVLSPMRSIPSDPLALARFARAGVPSVRHVAKGFTTDSARALLAGTAAHSMEPLTAPLTASFGLLLTALGHGAGWPVVQGGSAAITQGLATELRHLGGTRAHGAPDRLARRAATGPGRPARYVAPPVPPPRPRPALAGAPGGPGPASSPGRAPARSTGPSAGRCPGRPRRAGAR